MANHMIYVKFPDMRTFKPVDCLNGCTVSNLLYATLIPTERLEFAKDYAKCVKADQPEVKIQIRKVCTSKAIFSI